MPSGIPAKTIGDLEWKTLLTHLAERCHTELGAALARELEFQSTPDGARAQIAEISEARLLWEVHEPLPFGGIESIEPALALAEKSGVLEAPELLAVARTVRGCAVAKRHLSQRRDKVPLLAAIAMPILELEHVSGPILDSFDDSGRLLDHASAALGPLRKRALKLHEELGRRVRGLLDDQAVAPHLQDRFYTQREERYVVPVRAEARARVKGIVHGISQSGQTVFIEPEEIVDLNNRLKIAESEVVEEERRILAELTSYVREEIPRIRDGLARVVRLDVLDASARLADALSASAPDIDQDGNLLLKTARHPLMVLGLRECVANDIALAPQTALIVSGPNAGGKTVALKTAGLAALLLRAGMHVPADVGSRIPWYEDVLTDIGDEQSLERNLSTFSAHLLGLRGLLEVAGPRALFIIDEIAVGTEPAQGEALAQAVLEALVTRGAQVMTTTHYERLKTLALGDARFVNASVGFDLEKMSPTFRLHLGIPGQSGALFLARRLGIPEEIIASAEACLGPGRARVEETLAALNEEKQRIEKEREAILDAKRQANLALRAAEAAKDRANQHERQQRKGMYDEAVLALRRARDEAERLRARVKKEAPLKTELGGALGKIASVIAAHAPTPTSPQLPPANPAELVPGRNVIVTKLGGTGKIVSAPQKDRVLIQIGSLKTSVSLDDVALAPEMVTRKPRHNEWTKSAKADEEESPQHNEWTKSAKADEEESPPRSVDNTLDLRGERVDDALTIVDRFLDDGLLFRRSAVFIIHGHGTGALRQAVREHLSLCEAVSHWRAGTLREGGEGVTVAWLDSESS